MDRMKSGNTRGFGQKEGSVTSGRYDLCEYYSEMIRKCEFKIRKMLDDLVLIYKEYKVRFPVFQLEDTLMRMLIPLEFSSIIDNNQISRFLQLKEDSRNFIATIRLKNQMLATPGSEEAISAEMKQIFTNKIRSEILFGRDGPTKIYENKIHKLIEDKMKNKLLARTQPEGRHQAYNQHMYLPSNQDARFSDYEFINPPVKKTGTRSRGIEHRLCEWIYTRSQKGYPVNRTDVISRAREMGKECNLKASVGWYSNFIRRNPEIRKILAQGNMERRRSQFIIQPQEVKTEEYEESESFKNMTGGIYEDEDDEINPQNQPKHQYDEQEKEEGEEEEEDNYSNEIESNMEEENVQRDQRKQ